MEYLKKYIFFLTSQYTVYNIGEFNKGIEMKKTHKTFQKNNPPIKSIKSLCHGGTSGDASSYYPQLNSDYLKYYMRPLFIYNNIKMVHSTPHRHNDHLGAGFPHFYPPLKLRRGPKKPTPQNPVNALSTISSGPALFTGML